tara:strand:+ start:14653 stop:15360 length:708 start_codon:yes stop_codon:yes gene_type:complete
LEDFKKKIIVAIDTIDMNRALFISNSIPEVGALKLGLEFFCAHGPAGVNKILQTGAKIFLDLKFHDIPNTVSGAINASLKLCPHMMTVHLSGGYNMLKSSVDVVSNFSMNNNIKKPLILGVSVLTSIDKSDFSSIGFSGSVENQVKRLADLALRAGLDGLVCSAKELKIIREYVGKDILLVTPGIRPLGDNINDQKRIVTPSQAVKDGADFLVIGRPITEAEEPKIALNKICSEI